MELASMIESNVAISTDDLFDIALMFVDEPIDDGNRWLYSTIIADWLVGDCVNDNGLSFIYETFGLEHKDGVSLGYIINVLTGSSKNISIEGYAKFVRIIASNWNITTDELHDVASVFGKVIDYGDRFKNRLMYATIIVNELINNDVGDDVINRIYEILGPLLHYDDDDYVDEVIDKLDGAPLPLVLILNALCGQDILDVF